MKTYKHTSRGYMIQIDELIATLQDTRNKVGNTCVYIRGSVGWGATALNRQGEDDERDKAEASRTFDGGVALVEADAKLTRE